MYYKKNASHSPKAELPKVVPAQAGPSSAFLSSLRINRSEYPGLDEVINRARELAKMGRGDVFVRRAALDITAGIGKDVRTGHPNRRNRTAIANAVYAWMKRNIQYVRDPHNIEWLQEAKATLQLRSGDCDDMSILAAALLGSLGIPTRFLIIGQDAKTKQFGHIYAEYQNESGQWIPFDVVMATKPGDRPKNIVVSKIASLDGLDESYQPKIKKTMCNCSGTLAEVQDADYQELGNFLRKAKNTAKTAVKAGTQAAAGNYGGALTTVAKDATKKAPKKAAAPSAGPAPAPMATPNPAPKSGMKLPIIVGGIAAVGAAIWYFTK